MGLLSTAKGKHLCHNPAFLSDGYQEFVIARISGSLFYYISSSCTMVEWFFRGQKLNWCHNAVWETPPCLPSIHQAVCCKDGDHCCPNGYQCDQRQESCIRGGLVIGWYRKLEARSHPVMASDVKCDTQSSCPTGTTCCPLSTGQWGCCPLVQVIATPKQRLRI